MNFRKFISGVSALAIAAGAFVSMAVTASAADTTWDFNAWAHAASVSESIDPDTTTTRYYTIGTDGTYTTAADKSVSGELVLTIATEQEATKNHRTEGWGLKIRSGSELNYLPAEKGVLTIELGTSNGNLYAKKSSGSGNNDNCTVSSNGTYKVYVGANERIQLVAGSKKSVVIKKITWTPGGTKGDAADITAPAEGETYTADAGYEGDDAVAKTYTFTATAGVNAGLGRVIATDGTKELGRCATTIAKRSSAVFTIIATGATEEAIDAGMAGVTIYAE